MLSINFRQLSTSCSSVCQGEAPKSKCTLRSCCTSFCSEVSRTNTRVDAHKAVLHACWHQVAACIQRSTAWEKLPESPNIQAQYAALQATWEAARPVSKQAYAMHSQLRPLCQQPPCTMPVALQQQVTMHSASGLAATSHPPHSKLLEAFYTGSYSPSKQQRV